MPTTVRAIASGTEELVSRTRKTKAAETSRTIPPMSRFLFALTFSFLGSPTTSRPNDFGLSAPVPRWNRFGTTSPEVGLCRIPAMGPGVLVIKLTRVRPAMLTVCNQERFLSSQSRQLVEEQRSKTSPHLACRRDATRLKHHSIRTAYPAEGAKGSKPTSPGASATSITTTYATPPKWARRQGASILDPPGRVGKRRLAPRARSSPPPSAKDALQGGGTGGGNPRRAHRRILS
jgi:hypothetical protein